VIEGAIKNTDDFGAFIVDNCVGFLIPEDGHGKSKQEITFEVTGLEAISLPASEFGISLEIEIFNMRSADDGVSVCARKRIHIAEGPTMFAHPG
jgi:hypothetical protein